MFIGMLVKLCCGFFIIYIIVFRMMVMMKMVFRNMKILCWVFSSVCKRICVFLK